MITIAKGNLQQAECNLFGIEKGHNKFSYDTIQEIQGI